METYFPRSKRVDIGGGFSVWSPCAVVVTEDPSTPYDVKLELAIEDGRFEVQQLTATRKPGGPPLTTEQLRLVSVAKIAARAVAQVMPEIVQSAPGAFQIGGEAPSPADELEHVAALYRLAYVCGLHPIQHVADQLDIPKSTAAKKVIRAREAGLLGPATPGVAGEARTDVTFTAAAKPAS